MFYALRHYSLPFVLAVLLHALAGWSLMQGFSPDKTASDFVRPEAVTAQLIVLEARTPPPPKVDPAQLQRQAQAEQVAKERERQLQLEKERKEKEALEEQERKRLEQERLKKELEDQARAEREQERLKRLAELANTSFDEALAQESAALESTAEEAAAQSYRAGIRQRIVENWSRPPSARNGMKATLLIELIPTGEVVSVTVTESSGSAAFDRSAETAVRQARRFDVPSENRLFESYFRRVYLVFQPEDLLR